MVNIDAVLSAEVGFLVWWQTRLLPRHVATLSAWPFFVAGSLFALATSYQPFEILAWLFVVAGALNAFLVSSAEHYGE
jgi:hypothetical protein